MVLLQQWITGVNEKVFLLSVPNALMVKWFWAIPGTSASIRYGFCQNHRITLGILPGRHSHPALLLPAVELAPAVIKARGRAVCFYRSEGTNEL